MANIIDGKIISRKILDEVKSSVKLCSRPPCAAFIRVGDDPASVIYVNQKQKIARELGIDTFPILLPLHAQGKEILNAIHSLNENPEVDGILVQAPLPTMALQRAAFSAIDPSKDIDGFHPQNLGLLCQESDDGFLPCTPLGIMELIRSTGVDLTGKHAVVIGRSLIVGKPVGLLLLQKKEFANATVTFCHSKTKDIARYSRDADLLIVAVGRPGTIRADMVKPGAVVIDVGINRIPDDRREKGYRIEGDVDFENVREVAGFITPVPGGVGPMTIAMLMKNTLLAYQRHAHR
ncbi:MAG: bifunctional 5,10-methylenetetrahydrofolate dehydrogenase/5,10-methenyltetrahydrofolate cyclohydrolase [Puniceicoccales bacterium]|jgi:methylenetetrahydrofolate dehydrogenase (NADP+)/methenyltetrahydrofolate cyclohydrolase|nr:bifunctional 5,10-methylenetetrahydrofolate dehydrogenase/5,10-methenyltetrahydrofolate cyclohydrolase [Puniceicoccales bacterium]